MSKRLFPITFVLMSMYCGTLKAQDVSFTQYYMNLAGTNPGFTGMEDYTDIKLAFRQGWNDFGVKNDNLFASVYTPIGVARRLAVNRNSIRMSNVPAYQTAMSDIKLRRKQGFGGMVTSRNVGPYKSSQITLNYAYHLPLSRRMSLSFGTKVGYGSQRIDFNGYTVRDEVNDAFYQQLINASPGNQNTFSVDFGTVLYSRKFYLAFSSGNLVAKDMHGDFLLASGNRKQYQMQTAFSTSVSPNLGWSTGVKVTKSDGLDIGWAVNSRFRYKQFIYAGAAYDNVSKLSFLFGLTTKSGFSLNYSYDHYLTNSGNLNVSVHEVIVGIALFNKYSSTQKLW